MRAVYPTAAELQRMPWPARDKLKLRLRTGSPRPQRRWMVQEPIDLRAAARNWGDIVIGEYQKRYRNGDDRTSPHVIAGHLEYERRRKANRRAATPTQPRGPRKPPPPRYRTWSIDDAIARRAAGEADADIAARIGITVKSLRRAITTELRRREGQTAAGEAA